MIFRRSFLALLAILVAGAAQGRTPAALVVEIGANGAESAFAACEGVWVRRHAVALAPSLVHWLARRGDSARDWYAANRPLRAEEVNLLLLIRTPERCGILLADRGRGELPTDWRLPFWRWRLEGSTIRFEGRVASILSPRTRKEIRGEDETPWRLYHHGRLELLLDKPRVKPRRVGPGGVVSLHLEGPGDEERFLFRAAKSGSLLLERTPGDLPDLEMLMGPTVSALRSARLVRLEANEPLWVVFRYQGMDPLDLDVGFLFVEEPALTCRLHFSERGPDGWTATLWIVNGTGEPVVFQRPSVGTVMWYAGKKLVAAGRPGRPAAVTELQPGASLRYSIQLDPGAHSRPDSAEVDLGPPFGTVRCE